MEQTGLKIAATVPSEKFIGLLLSYDKKLDSIKNPLTHAQKVLSCLGAIEMEYLNNNPIWPIGIIMPCGEKALFKNALEFPTKTLMCPCGDNSHTVVQINF